MKNRSHRYDINRPRPRHGYKYAKYKMYDSTVMAIYVLSKTEPTFEVQFMKKVKQH